jgi:hypothetical protein
MARLRWMSTAIALRSVAAPIIIVDYGIAKLAPKTLPALLFMGWAPMAEWTRSTTVATLCVEECARLTPARLMMFAADRVQLQRCKSITNKLVPIHNRLLLDFVLFGIRP